MKKKEKFTLTNKDQRIVDLVSKTDHKILGKWVHDCVDRYMFYFEEKYPQDQRPRKALETLQEWIDTGIFKMKIIRKASLDAHAAAREVGEDNAARSVARAAGQAVATAHVPTHSIGAVQYILQAIYRIADPLEVDALLAKERDWQYKYLLEIKKEK